MGPEAQELPVLEPERKGPISWVEGPIKRIEDTQNPQNKIRSIRNYLLKKPI